MNPVIGVTPTISENNDRYIVSRNNCRAIEWAGGTPFILPYIDAVEVIAAQIDGLYVTGGNDIDPAYYGEQPMEGLGRLDPTRDQFEVALIQAMLTLGKPVLGVCRGAQILNVVLGGTMYQDIASQVTNATIQHRQQAPAGHPFHDVEITKDSLLFRITGETSIRVNSRHHQANKEPGEGLVFSGFSSDGIVEAVESTTHPFVLGVQWHPEDLLQDGVDVVSGKIYTSFIQACLQK